MLAAFIVLSCLFSHSIADVANIGAWIFSPMLPVRFERWRNLWGQPDHPSFSIPEQVKAYQKKTVELLIEGFLKATEHPNDHKQGIDLVFSPETLGFMPVFLSKKFTASEGVWDFRHNTSSLYASTVDPERFDASLDGTCPDLNTKQKNLVFNEATPWRDFAHAAACALKQVNALQNTQTYAMINMLTVQDCVGECPKQSEGQRNLYLNTNVVFKPDGRIHAIYHKRHPFQTVPKIDPAPTPMQVTWEIKGVKMGTVICFDLDFKDPAWILGANPDVKNWIYATYWPDDYQGDLVYGFRQRGAQQQAAFARANQLNFFSANGVKLGSFVANGGFIRNISWWPTFQRGIASNDVPLDPPVTLNFNWGSAAFSTMEQVDFSLGLANMKKGYEHADGLSRSIQLQAANLTDKTAFEIVVGDVRCRFALQVDQSELTANPMKYYQRYSISAMQFSSKLEHTAQGDFINEQSCTLAPDIWYNSHNDHRPKDEKKESLLPWKFTVIEMSYEFGWNELVLPMAGKTFGIVMSNEEFQWDRSTKSVKVVTTPTSPSKDVMNVKIFGRKYVDDQTESLPPPAVKEETAVKTNITFDSKASFFWVQAIVLIAVAYCLFKPLFLDTKKSEYLLLEEQNEL